MFPGPRTTAAFEASDVLALELDMLDPDIRERLLQGADAAPATSGCRAPLVARLEQRMAAECVDAAAMARLSRPSSRSHRWR